MIQIDIEMPKTCCDCPLHDGEYGWCNLDYDIIMSCDDRPERCPLHEVTNSDTISRQAVLDAMFSEPLYKSGMKKRDADAVIPVIYEKIKALPPSPSRQTEQQIHCNNCKHYQGVHGVQGHAPCSYWKSGGVLWNWYCSQAEPYKEGGAV